MKMKIPIGYNYGSANIQVLFTSYSKYVRKNAALEVLLYKSRTKT